MNRMRDLINKSKIWKFLGGVSAMSGLGCFGLSSTYKMSFGLLGSCGLIVYLGISLSIFYLIWGFKTKIQVPERFQVVVATLLLVVICLISAELDKLVPGKSDALSIISYGLFAILSLCVSRKSELGFETGFFTFFVSLFLEQIYKTNLNLFPIAIIFCLVILVLRHLSQSGSLNGDRPQEVVPLINATATATGYHLDLELGQVSGESVSSTNDQQNNPEESSQAAHHPPNNNGRVSEESTLEETHSSFRARRRSPSNYGQVSEEIIEEIRSSFLAARHRLPSNDGQVSEENMSDGGSEQNNEQEEDSNSSLVAESSYSSEQDHVSSANYQNGYVHSHPSPQLRRRRRRMTRATQNISSSLGDTLRRWHPPRLFSFFFFFFLIPTTFCSPNLIIS